MIPELRDHILSFLSPDSLLPPSLLELSRLLKRPTLDLIMLRKDAAPPPSSYEGFVYSGPVWIVRVTRSELRQVRSPEYIGFRLTSLVPGVSTVITKVYSKLRGRACAWETSGLLRAQLLVPVSQADEEYLQAWHCNLHTSDRTHEYRGVELGGRCSMKKKNVNHNVRRASRAIELD